jgi:type I restriction enzyme, S subunit
MSKGPTVTYPRLSLREIAAPEEDSFVDGPFGSNLRSHEYTETGVRLIQLQNIGDGFWSDGNRKFISEAKFRGLTRHGAVPGDIAIAKMADPVARACIVPETAGQFVVVADCIRMRVDSRRYDARYIAYAINSQETRREAECKAIGTTRLRINLGTLKTVRCPVPSKPEQVAIVQALEELQRVITGTEKLLAKLRSARDGLLNDLLTRGIDESGHLRPAPDEAPDLYRPSPIGLIPQDWETPLLGELATNVTSGSRDWARYYSESGSRFIRIGNLTREHPNLRWDDVIFVRPPPNGEGQRTRLEADDILVSITADLGIVGIVPTELGPAYINQHIAVVRLDLKEVNARFVGHYLSGHRLQSHLARLNDAGAKAGLNLPTIRNLPVSVPIRREEQDAIAARLDETDSKIARLRNELAKQHALKSGLADDLLTGRVRVTPLLGGAVEPELESAG